jgi:large subunit ribosomal protein L25
MEQYQLKAKTREIKGKKVKQLRANKELPVVLYGAGVEPKLLTVNEKEFESVYNQAAGSSLIKLYIDDNKEPANILFHEVDYHPYSDRVVHVDMLQVKLNEKIKADIDIVIINAEEAPVVKEKEGSIVANKDSVEVEAFPQDLINEIEVDVANITDFDQTVYVKDLVVPSTIKILDDPEEIVVVIQEPRSEEEMAELDEEVVEDVEKVEVEEKGKDEEESSEEPEKE